MHEFQDLTKEIQKKYLPTNERKRRPEDLLTFGCDRV
jgi:hypothetical protein